jgi:hypothetical protein
MRLKTLRDPKPEAVPDDLRPAVDAAVSAVERDSRTTSRYTRDQRTALRWLGGLLATGALAWGCWSTVQISDLKTAAAVNAVELRALRQQMADLVAALRGGRP